MAESLLAHLYSRIRGSQEDVATMSLQYIITSSSDLNAAFNKLLSDSLKISLAPDVSYSCQSVGDDMERPDMSGVDKSGNEVVLCEMKFYAGLTENQPVGYLNRLKTNGGRALVFVCPEARKVSLWNKLKDICTKECMSLEDENGYCITVNGIAMGIVTWAEIIDVLRRVASVAAVESLHDIEQLSGFCNLMDQKAFIPFRAEELGPTTPLLEDRYYQVVDGVVRKLCTYDDLSPKIKGKQSPYKCGYARNIILKDYLFGIIYDRYYWSNSFAESPFWITVRTIDDKQPKELNRLYDKIPAKERAELYGVKGIAVHPLVDVPLDEVVDAFVEQIMKCLKLLG